MAEKDGKIIFYDEDDNPQEFYVVEQTMIAGVNYLLVETGSEDEDEAECLILKENSKGEDEDALYDIVEDENELEAIAKVFEGMLEDTDIELR
ncbi:MAG: DUF1292 domain-containing protein [Lachnospiraceae bacterium]|nr:DUF1292 domain-containing protein [Lachnospiraceae bacterium]MCR4779184.1 DUF1292 domain-containing protein [Lachnospiraceae bacterium]